MEGDVTESQPSGVTGRGGGWPVLLATGLGAGYSRFAPGTMGALVGLPIVAACHLAPFPASAAVTAAVSVALFFSGVWLSFRGAAHFAVKDPRPVVIDEIASLPITFFLIPRMDVGVLAAGFALNRMMDVLKPPPARQLEHRRGGWGIMLDDTFAGLYSCVLLHLFYWLLWQGVPGRSASDLLVPLKWWIAP
jgi:phosphatidylglycerophosphatase A